MRQSQKHWVIRPVKTCARLLMSSLVSCCIAVALSSTGSCLAETIELFGETMGTHYFLRINSDGPISGQQELSEKVSARLKEINHQMSTWESDSEISRFNQSTKTDWFPVSEEFAKVVIEAKRIHELTEGAFDPTVSPLIDLWGFGDDREKTIPNEDAISAALETVGMDLIEVRLDPPGLKKHKPSVELNLSAIAKGYGVDALAHLVRSEGHDSFVVDIGGETRAGNAKVDEKPWRIGIESALANPLDPNHVPPRRIIGLVHASIATSGDYRNAFIVDGKRYSHTIDPKTGWPVENPPSSVSVIANDCMTADAWATAMMVLGVERGTEVAEQEELSVMFQTVVDGDTIQEATTGIFDVADHFI